MELDSKKNFVSELSTLLVKYGDGRYDDFKENPLTYTPVINGATGGVTMEMVTRGGRTANVTGDSLIGILCDIVEQGVI